MTRIFDPITATPQQLTAHIWHLTEQRGNLFDTGFELDLIGEPDPNIERQLDTLDAELALVEALDRLVDRDFYYETDAMSTLRFYANAAGHLDCDVDTFKRVLISLERQGFTLHRKEQLAA